MLKITMTNGTVYTYKNKYKYGAQPMDDGSLHVFNKENGKPVAFFASGQWLSATRAKGYDVVGSLD